MKYSWIDTELLQKPGVTKDLQAEWNWIRYHIGGKMFAAVCLDDATGKPVYITCKLDPAEGDFLRRQYEDIIPGYYMNKVHWNSVKAEGNVPDALLREMLEKSYRLVLGGFSKKKQRELLEGEKKANHHRPCDEFCGGAGQGRPQRPGRGIQGSDGTAVRHCVYH